VVHSSDCAVTVCAFEIPKFDHFWANMARMSTRWSTNAACEEAMEVSPLANSMCTPYYCTFPRATTRCTFSRRKIVHETARLVSSATRLSVSFLLLVFEFFLMDPSKSSKNRTRGRMLRPQEQDSRENAPPSKNRTRGRMLPSDMKAENCPSLGRWQDAEELIS